MSNSTTNNLPTYENLFGETDDHTVAPSQSVLSPGAYYMELRKLVSQYISLGKGAIPLDTRRPDLENLAFDKDTTFAPFSKLKIVNELLEKLVPLQNLSTHNYPFNLPYDSIHQQIETYLSKNGATLFETRKQLTANDPRLKSGFELPEALGLSVAQWTFYSTPLSVVSKQASTTPTKIVAETYGLGKETDSAKAFDPVKTLGPVNTLKKAEVFLLKTGLNLAELESLLYQNLSASELKASQNKLFYINDYAGSTGVVEFGEQGLSLKNLTLTNLYRINRFIRLSKALNWSFPQLDLALRTAALLLTKKPAINDAALPILSWIFRQVDEYKISVEQACALLAPLKNYGTKNGPTFFSQVFANKNIPNCPKWAGASGKYQTHWVVPVHHKKNYVPSANNISDQNALANALGLSQNDLIAIGMVLLPDPKKNQTITLSLQNMALLYRLSLLPKMMGVSVTDFLMIADTNGLSNAELVSVVGVATAPKETSMEAMTTLLDFSKWLKTFPINLGHLQFIVTGESRDPAVHNAIIGNDSIENFQQNLNAEISKVLLTENQFFHQTKADFQQLFSQAVGPILQFCNAQLQKTENAKTYEATFLKDAIIELNNALTQNASYAQKICSPLYLQLQKPNYLDLLTSLQTKNNLEGITLVIIDPNKPSHPLVNEEIEKVKQSTAQKVATYTISTQNHSIVLSVKNQACTITIDGKSVAGIAPKDLRLMVLSLDANGIVVESNWSTNVQSLIAVFQQQLDGILTKLLPSKTWPNEISKKLGTVISKSAKNVQFAQKIQLLTLSNSNKSYEIQQKIFISHIAGLYHVPIQIAKILKTWGDLNLAKITTIKPVLAKVPANQRLSLLNFVSNRLNDASLDTLASTLKKLQQAAYLIVDLQLSAAEANYFKLKNTSTNVYPISLQTVKTLEQFKRLAHNFEDSQNNLLTILQLGDVTDQQNLLTKLSGWPQEQINYFCSTIRSSENAKNTISSNQIYSMQLFFELTEKLGINLQMLWQICQFQGKDCSVTPQSIANALWAGLRKNFSLEELASTKNSLDQQLRDHLVPLAIDQLNETNPSRLNGRTDARALYEYLLLDVEVSGVVETSTVKEAISALQLYIYRCLNQLEPGVTADPELKKLWTWMHAYREWEANQEVLLWPENYIQPELRKDKTPQFAQLQGNLKQADLTNPDAVEAVFLEYMNGFEEVATLTIVGSAGRDWNDGGIHTKEICFVGKTKKQPSKYFYRVATFIRSTTSNEYKPVTWGQWDEINIPIHPAANGAVNPVFAFGKWYVFWMEEHQVGSIKNIEGQQESVYNTSIKYTHLNYSKRWNSAENLAITTIPYTQKITRINSIVYPVYINSIQKIFVIFEDIIYDLSDYSIVESEEWKNCIGAFKYQSKKVPKLPPVLNFPFTEQKCIFQYYPDSALSPSTQASTLSTWFNVNQKITQLTNSIQIEVGKGVSIQGVLYTANIKADTWYHFVVSENGATLSGKLLTPTGLPNVYVGTNGSGLFNHVDDTWKSVTSFDETVTHFIRFEFAGELYIGTTNGLYQFVGGIPKILFTGPTIRCHYVFKKQLYVGTSSGVYYLNGSTWKQISESKSPPINGCRILMFESMDDNLYIGTNKGLYELEHTGTWNNSFTQGPTSKNFISVLKVIGNTLYVGTWDNADTNATGLYSFTNAKWKNDHTHGPDKTSLIADVFNFNEDLFVTTETSGTYRYTTKWSNKFIPKLKDTITLERHIEFDNKLYTCIFGKGVYVLDNKGSWTKILTWADGEVDCSEFFRDGEMLLIGTSLGIHSISLGKNEHTFYRLAREESGGNNFAPFQYIFQKYRYSIYVGTDIGLYEIKNNEFFQSFKNGPAKNDSIGFLEVFNDRLFVSSGNYISSSGECDVFILKNGVWDKGFETKQMGIKCFQTNFYSISQLFSGLLQETLYFKTALDQSQMFQLYDNSRNSITQDFENFIPQSQRPVTTPHTCVPILMQPNWDITLGNGSEYLMAPYSPTEDSSITLKPYRLNTTAINKLSHLLNGPDGIKALLNINAQKSAEIPLANDPKSEIDFSINSAMANYYWELFFHAPFLVAKELNLHQHFDAAKLWYQYIFDPTVSPLNADVKASDKNLMDRFWRFLGLRSDENPTLRKELGTNPTQEIWNDLNNQTDQYISNTDPFDPQALANLRPIAYQKTMVTHYISNLINWGDQLFRENTRESIVEAEMQYVEAYDLLGKTPVERPESDLNYESAQVNNGTTHSCFKSFSGVSYSGTSGNGLWVLNTTNNHWEQCTSTKEDVLFKSVEVTCIHISENITLIGTQKNGLWQQKGVDWEQVTMLNTGSLKFGIGAIAEYKGQLIVGTICSDPGTGMGLGNGVWVAPTAFSIVTWSLQSLPNSAKGKTTQVVSMVENDLGFFMGTETSGCYQYKDKTWSLITPKGPTRAKTSSWWVKTLYTLPDELYLVTQTDGIWVGKLERGKLTWTELLKLPAGPAKPSPVRGFCKNESTNFVAINFGGFWSSKNGNPWVQLPNLSTSVKGELFLSMVNEVICVGDIDAGFTVSFDNGNTWTYPIPELTKCTVTNFQLVGNTLHISTKTKGIWTFGVTLSSSIRLKKELLSNKKVTHTSDHGSTLYAGTNGEGLWQSTNSGTTWSQCQGNTTAFLTTEITCIYIDGSQIFVGTDDQGLWTLNNHLWAQISGLDSVFHITCLIRYQDTLFVGTFGNGIWGAKDGSQSWEQQTLNATNSDEQVSGASETSATYDITNLVVRNSELYAGTYQENSGKGNGCYCYSGNNQWNLIQIAGQTVEKWNVTSLYSYNDDLLLATYFSGVWKHSPTKSWYCLGFNSDTPNVMMSSGSRLFIGTYEEGLHYIDGKNIGKLSSIPNDANISSIQSFQGIVLVGTQNSGFWYSPDNGETWSQPINALSSESVNSIEIIENVAYLSSDSGLWQLTLNPFEIPRNEQFLSHWDTVQQRIFNIRHGLNINGQPDQLPLFQPAINPMELVSAVASGEGIAQAISSLNSIVPYYRFSVMVGKAKETTQMTIQLGQSVLSAIEKKDAEKLAVLYQTNQHHISQLSIANKQDQIGAAQKNIAALQAGSTAATDRKKHYSKLITDGQSSYEKTQVSMQKGSVIAQDVVEGIKAASIIGYGLPNIAGLADGGMHFGDAINQGAEIAQGIGTVMNVQSGLAATIGGFKRRAEDWKFQKATAEDDIKQIAIQILASKYQLSIAEKELVLLKTEIQQGQKVAEFYKKKFSNEQLYQWYIGQVSALYFQAYSLSHEVAMQAENAWKFEHIGQMSSNDPLQFIQSGYWNSLYEGLLAGEGLLLDVHRMEKAFMDEDVRPLEIEKTFSLKELPNVEFSNLQTKGQCLFSFTQTDFDDDFPDHYCRKIKSISVSIPMVVGPYQTIPATLVQQSSRININTAGKDIYVKNKVTKKGNSEDQRVDLRPNQQIALSKGVNDNGMFTLNFDDPRYLPFEGTGAISNWNLLINNKNIDISTLTDVIIQVKYTALPGDPSS